MNPRINNSTAQPVIGITGGMGSGKSAVAGFLSQRFGATYIDADAVCRELLEPEAAGWRSFTGIFGSDYLDPDGRINRELLRKAIFADEMIRRQVNAIIHPLAREEICRRLEAATDARWFLIEVPLLFEAGWEAEVDRVIVVYADRDSCLRRLMQRDGLQKEEAERSMGAQWPLPEKAMLADYTVDNSGPWLFTCLQILHLGELLQDNF
jgi:dephospho-CoA kinase